VVSKSSHSTLYPLDTGRVVRKSRRVPSTSSYSELP
jgi:hypothetical protein